MKNTIACCICAAALCSCSGSDRSAPAPRADDQIEIAPPPGPDTARCDKLLAELRALRDGPQPCAEADDCTVFHNGEHWDGCPTEVNKTNCAVLDRMRAEIDGLGCPVDQGAQCAAQEVKGCVAGGCGGKAPAR